MFIKWATDYIKYGPCKVASKLNSFNIFVTGGAGEGKSHLLKTIQMSINKLLMHKGGDLDKPIILLLAQTDVTATNIDGTTIHSALGIRAEGKFTPLSDQQRVVQRNKISEVKLMIIDDVSTISIELFFSYTLNIKGNIWNH